MSKRPPRRTGIRLGILGASGLLGSALCRHLGAVAKVEPITRENYAAKKGMSFDVLINANGNSRRFWADEHPLEDLEASTVSVYRSLFDFHFKQYVYISSPDVYADHTRSEVTEEHMAERAGRSPYGLNKFLAEQVVQNYAGSYLIIRPAALLGPGLKKGPVFDILNGRSLFVTGDSRIQFITTRAVADCLWTLLKAGAENEVFNVAGVGHTKMSGLGRILGKKAKIAAGAKRQRYEMNTRKAARRYPFKTSDEYVSEYLRDAAEGV